LATRGLREGGKKKWDVFFVFLLLWTAETKERKKRGKHAVKPQRKRDRKKGTNSLTRSLYLPSSPSARDWEKGKGRKGRKWSATSPS